MASTAFIPIFCMLILLGNSNNITAIQVQPILYLNNIIKIHTILQFLYSNKTIPYTQLKSQIENRIAQERLQYTTQEKDLEVQLRKTSCWLCEKQFKNTSYLALHYVVRHNNQLSQIFGIEESNNDMRLIKMIMRHPIYKKITSDDLSVLFQTSFPQHKRLEYCTNLFTYVYSQTKEFFKFQIQSQYLLLEKENMRKELCTIIALEMIEHNAWVSVKRWVSLFIIALVTLVVLTYLYDILYSSSQPHKKKKTRYYN